MRPKNLEQKGVKRLCLQSELSVPVHAETGVPLFHLRHAGRTAPRTRQAGVPSLRNTKRREGRVSRL